MENTPEKPSPACCCSTDDGTGKPCVEENRRGFLAKAIAVVAGSVALAVPAVVGIIASLNPLRQKSQAGLLLRLTSLDALPEDGTPRRFPIIADRTDAWNRFPNEPIGAVYLRRTGAKSVEAIQSICPHAGCIVQFTPGSGEGDKQDGGKFFCPCHAASFDLAGKRLDETSPCPRDLDTLEVDIRGGVDVWVKFEGFQTGTAKKVAKV